MSEAQFEEALRLIRTKIGDTEFISALTVDYPEPGLITIGTRDVASPSGHKFQFVKQGEKWVLHDFAGWFR
jgi:hypothetical protein